MQAPRPRRARAAAATGSGLGRGGRVRGAVEPSPPGACRSEPNAARGLEQEYARAPASLDGIGIRQGRATVQNLGPTTVLPLRRRRHASQPHGYGLPPAVVSYQFPNVQTRHFRHSSSAGILYIAQPQTF
ncbi:hypothetical protein SEVIR_3G027301v4 [Setaria viridis]